LNVDGLRAAGAAKEDFPGPVSDCNGGKAEGVLAAHNRDINLFLERRRPHWRRLEALLSRVEGEGLRALPPAEVREFGGLYRRASSDLVTARSRTANAQILEYLNDLVARAYAQVYRTKRRHWRDVWIFLSLDFPRLFRRHFRYILAAFAFFMSGALIAGVAGARDPAAVEQMVPSAFLRMWSREAHVPAANDKTTSAKPQGRALNPSAMIAGSAFYMTHNSQVALTSFVLGITAGIGSIVFMFVNGVIMGAVASHTVREGIAFAFWSFVASHGVIEMTAIFIAGGAGMLMGLSLIAPGKRTRREALVERSRSAVLLAMGCVPMLILAGVIEACISPFPLIPGYAKISLSLLSVAGLALYFGFVGRGPQPGNLDELTRF